MPLSCGYLVSGPADGDAVARSSHVNVRKTKVVVAAGIRYDNWSCFQSRLCFQSMVPILLCFTWGMESFEKSPRLRQVGERAQAAS